MQKLEPDTKSTYVNTIFVTFRPELSQALEMIKLKSKNYVSKSYLNIQTKYITVDNEK